MKKYLFILGVATLLVFGFRAMPAHAAITFVQSNGGAGVAGSTGVAFSSNVTVGDYVYAALFDGNGVGDTLSFSDSQGNSWTNATTTNLNLDGDTMAVACAQVSSTGADTVNFSVGGNSSLTGYLVVYEAQGASCTVDKIASLDNQTATTTCATPQITTTNAKDLLLTSCGQQHNGLYSSGAGGSHIQNVTSTAANNTVALEMQTSTATSTFKGKMTSAASSSEQLGIIVAYDALTAPAISNVTSSPGTTSATITWTTNPGADSLVNYGTSSSYTASSTYNGTYVTSHSVSLTGLTASTTYHFQVVSSRRCRRHIERQDVHDRRIAIMDVLPRTHRHVIDRRGFRHERKLPDAGFLHRRPLGIDSARRLYPEPRHRPERRPGAGRPRLCDLDDELHRRKLSELRDGILQFIDGDLVDWVNVPSMYAGAVIYVCYDNASVSADQSHPSSTWNSSYAAVFHLPSIGGSLNVNNSTANANAMTNEGAAATTGEIGGAASFTAGSSQYIMEPMSG